MAEALEAARAVWFANDPTPPVHPAVLEKLEGRLFNAIRPHKCLELLSLAWYIQRQAH